MTNPRLISMPSSPSKEPTIGIVTFTGIQSASRGKFGIHAEPNEYFNKPDEYGVLAKQLMAGKSYLMGDGKMTTYVRQYTKRMNEWQHLAYFWAVQNPSERLILLNDRWLWRVFKRTEFVEFSLPSQDRGGEKNYVSTNGTTMILTNED